ncbi:hypothetical protein AGMMS49938_18880 [Fibrobacterales bacterium]|nr:hypothetical protein AGMMS49938_18880 [Fibrobacterales bacterium]
MIKTRSLILAVALATISFTNAFSTQNSQVKQLTLDEKNTCALDLDNDLEYTEQQAKLVAKDVDLKVGSCGIGSKGSNNKGIYIVLGKTLKKISPLFDEKTVPYETLCNSISVSNITDLNKETQIQGNATLLLISSEGVPFFIKTEINQRGQNIKRTYTYIKACE